jgi:hypothetical protein
MGVDEPGYDDGVRGVDLVSPMGRQVVTDGHDLAVTHLDVRTPELADVPVLGQDGPGADDEMASVRQLI